MPDCLGDLPVCSSPEAVLSYKMLLFSINITQLWESCLETPLFPLKKLSSTGADLVGSSGALPAWAVRGVWAAGSSQAGPQAFAAER